MTYSINILFIEDDKDIIQHILHTLHQAGFEPNWHIVQSEGEYLDCLKKGPDLILADCALENLTAARALELLQERPLDVPFIIITNKLNEATAVDCLNQGATDYLFHDQLGRLGPIIKQILELKQLRVDQQNANQRLYDTQKALRESEERYLALVDISSTLNNTLDLDEVLDRILLNVGRVVAHDGANIAFIQSGVVRVVRSAGYSLAHELLITASDFPLDEHPNLRKIVEEQQPVVIPVTRRGPEWGAQPGFEWLRSYVGAPIVVKGEVIGCINLDSKTANRFSVADARELQIFANQAAIAIYNARLYQTLEMESQSLKQAVEDRTAELRQAMERKDAFVANVSHELRTPMSALMLNSALMRRKPESATIYLDRVDREVDRLRSALESLLALSLLDQDRLKPMFAALDLNQLTEQYVTDRRLMAEGRGLEMTLTRPLELPPVLADAELLGQVLSILLTNAMNYTPTGGQITVATQTKCLKGQKWVGFSVSDTGPGIPVAEHARLFERFYRGTTARRSGVSGSGLGLSIVKEIVDRHQGQISVDSKGIPGQGVTFTIWLRAALGEVS